MHGETVKLVCHLFIFLFSSITDKRWAFLFSCWYHQGRNLYWRRNVVSGIIHGFLIYSTKRWNIKLNIPRLDSSTYLKLHPSHIHSAVRGSRSYGFEKLYYPLWQSIALMSDSL
jgi:hypothetical protein